MKKILIIVGAFVGFILASTNVNAAPQCDSNQAPNLRIEDPACYTSRSTTWTENYTYTAYETRTSSRYCRWRCGYPLYICQNSSTGADYFATSTAGRYNCHAYSSMCYNSCGGSDCENGSPRDYWGTVTVRVPVTRTGYRQRTGAKYTCYYTTVNSWSVCSDSGVQSATNVTQLSATGTSCQNRNKATTRTCPACGPANDVPTGTAPSSGLCAASNAPSSPSLSGTNWNWTCTASTGSVSCSAPNEENGECNSTYHNQTIDSPGLNGSEDLCTGGIVSNFNAATSNGPWTWDCDPIGANEANGYITEHCNANCFDFTTQVNPNPFPWPTNGDPVTVDVSVNATGMCASDFTCTTPEGEDSFNAVGGSTQILEIDQGLNNINIPIECMRKPTNPTNPGAGTDDSCTKLPCTSTIQINGYCTAKACNAQGTCQSTPISSNSYNEPHCTTSCNSSADCSSGSIIETRP